MDSFPPALASARSKKSNLILVAGSTGSQAQHRAVGMPLASLPLHQHDIDWPETDLLMTMGTEQSQNRSPPDGSMPAVGRTWSSLTSSTEFVSDKLVGIGADQHFHGCR